MPRPRRLTTPGYGFDKVREPGAKLPWADIERQLVEARTYWIATTRPDGRPHIAPVWGAWLDESCVFETTAESVKAKNLSANPAVVVHIDHTEAAVIVEGRAEPVDDSTLVARYAQECATKYNFDVGPYLARPASRVLRIVPRVAYSYKEHLGQTATRWDF